MPQFDVILQGGGRLALVLPEGTDPATAGSFMDVARAHMESGAPIAILNGVGRIIDNRPLNEQELTRVTTRDRSSGKYHVRYIEVQLNGDERTLVDERCQADQSGSYDVVEEVPEASTRDVLCYYCYPPVEEDRGYTAGPIG